MLVLSRRPHEKIVIPAIHTTIEVLSVKPGTVRLGIQAPGAVGVFRNEVVGNSALAATQPDFLEAAADQTRLRELNHHLRNRSNALTLGVALLRRQMQEGLSAAAAATLERMDGELTILREKADALLDPPAATPRPCRALVVEDDQNERELLAGYLRLAGVKVDTAADGDEAIDHLHKGVCPDVLFLDMMLPHCDGPSTIRAIRQDPDPALGRLRIVAISGYTPERFGLDYVAGVDRWVRKPFNPEILLREVAAPA